MLTQIRKYADGHSGRCGGLSSYFSPELGIKSCESLAQQDFYGAAELHTQGALVRVQQSPPKSPDFERN